MDSTITYYNINATKYYNKTITAEMSSVYRHFTGLLKPGSCICDLGCGSGRDSKYFISQGFTVLPIDGSREMCRLASELLKQKVECLEFDDIDYENKFDAIWACSSLLHIPKNKLSHILEKLIRSVKNNAVIYTCFKLGNSERITDGRFFSDYTHDEMLNFISKNKCMELIEIWISDDVRSSHDRLQWLNIIAKVIKGNP
jgi:SAM-dependent methyltransferase